MDTTPIKAAPVNGLFAAIAKPDGGSIPGIVVATSDADGENTIVTIVDFDGGTHNVDDREVITPILGGFVDRWCETIADAVDGPGTVPPDNYRERLSQMRLLWGTLAGLLKLENNDRLIAQKFVQTLFDNGFHGIPHTPVGTFRMVKVRRGLERNSAFLRVDHISRISCEHEGFVNVTMADGSTYETTMTLAEFGQALAMAKDWTASWAANGADLISPSDELVEV